MWLISLGGILCIFFLSDAVFLCYRDIFSVTKLTRSLVIVSAACYYVAFSHINLSWEIYQHLSWILFWICLMLSLLGGRECYFVTVYFGSLFLTYLYTYIVYEQRHLVRRFWINICPFRWIFKAVCILSYLLVSCFSLAYCRAVCFFALVKILAENI